jgi:hypothetical protein
MKNYHLFLAVLLAFACVQPLAAVASTTYTYIGGTFTDEVGAYNGLGSNITGQFVVAEQLPSRSPMMDISNLVSTYSFSDGVQSLNQGNSKILGFSVRTDSRGVPRTWSIAIWQTPVTTSNGGQVAGMNIFYQGSNSFDTGFTDGQCYSNGGPGGECDGAATSVGSNYAELAILALEPKGNWSCGGCSAIPIPASQVWTEQADAPSFPDGKAQVTRGRGRLTSIVGSTNSGSLDYRDAYCLRIVEPSTFFATTDSRRDPAAGSDFDNSLFLFRADGAPVLANVDSPPLALPNSATLTWQADDGSNFELMQRGEYTLVINGAVEYPFDRDSVALFDIQPEHLSWAMLHAADPAAGHFDSWMGTNDSGSYTVVLNGAEYCQTDLDAAFSNPGQAGKVCVGDNKGKFSCEDTTVGGSPNDVAIGIFGSDNRPKLIYAANNGNKNRFCFNTQPGIYFCGNVSDDLNNSEAVAIGHVNDDQYPDLVFANDGQANQVCLSDFLGNFTCNDAHADALASRDVALGYINKDRFLDAVFTNGNDVEISLCLGDGSGTFNCDNTQLPFSINAGRVALGHVNADTHLDVVFTRPGNNSKVCLGDGNGAFTCSDIIGPQNASGLALGDVNNDGVLDAVFSMPNQNPNVRCLGDGSGVFSCSNINNETITSKDVALGLVDDDSNLDAVFANENTPNQLCLGNGSGGFTCSLIDDDFGNTQSVVLGEFWINLLFGNGFE